MFRPRSFAASLVALVAVALMAAPAVGNHSNFDAFNHEVINPTPYRGGDQRTFEVGPINTSSYTFQGSPEPAACGSLNPLGKTAWVRFNSAVAGQLDVTIISDFNVVGYAHELKAESLGTTNPTVADIRDMVVDSPVNPPSRGSCTNANPGNGESLPYLRVDPRSPVWVQVGGFCTENPCTDRNTTPPTLSGTISTLRLVFTPDDADGDRVADTLDSCKGVKGDLPNGCLRDDDRDSVPDKDDSCKGVTGDLPNGCLRDTDGDDTPDKSDSCDNRPGERSDGCPRALEATFDICFQNFRRYSRIVRRRPRGCGRAGKRKSGFLLKVKPEGLKGRKIRFKCRPKPRCPVDDFGPRAFTRKAVEVLRSDLVNERFRRGAKLEFFLTRKDTWGAYRKFTIRGRGKRPKGTSKCLDSISGKTRPLADCDS